MNRIVRSVSLTSLLMVGIVGTSHAFTLERMAGAIDLSRFTSGVVSLPSSQLIASIPQQLIVPASVNLAGPIAELRVGLPCECDVTIEVADDAGAPLFLAECHMPQGWQKVAFSGRDSSGAMLPNGTYYYTVTADGISRTTRIVVNR
ncbi:MAG TPA: hypothetical protein VFH33_05135 [Candidatus Krumholzibacteria bacterium]|nr:hypothetical protein [Candidatus Krumholzibacteria bacterium]